MPWLPSLPENASLLDLRNSYPFLALLRPYAERIMRGPSPLTPGQRELIAAYVSGLNACRYCYGSHSRVAQGLGIDENVFTRLMDDVEQAPVEESLKPLLRYAGKLTETPTRLTQADADAVYAAGWPEEALMHTIAVCAYFNNMNRLVEGTGIIGSPESYAIAARNLIKRGYSKGSAGD